MTKKKPNLRPPEEKIDRRDFVKVYNFLYDFKRDHQGRTPSLRVIDKVVKIKSISQIAKIIRILHKMEYLILDDSDRSFRITFPGESVSITLPERRVIWKTKAASSSPEPPVS